MGREIKFRIFSNGKIYNTFNLEWFKENSQRPDNFHTLTESWIWPDDSILLQYTGLQDKNGKEIYEGDIVHSDLLNITAAMEFANGGFGIHKIRADLKVVALYGALSYEFKIIGNIYENPELLEVTNEKS